jgi:hypothetical protein
MTFCTASAVYSSGDEYTAEIQPGWDIRGNWHCPREAETARCP